MNISDAQRVMETLRKGIPPDGYVRYFTVGRKSEIEALETRLHDRNKGALLLKANYGSGKTHLLRFLREFALDQGYAVSTVSLDARSAVRFNRMDQMLGAIWRGLEIPEGKGVKGARPYLGVVCRTIEATKSLKTNDYWHALTNGYRWDYSEVLKAPAFFVALRAWSTGIPEIHDLVEDWLFQPWIYQAQRRHLYTKLVEELRSYFRDPRPEWKFYNDGTFNFQSQGYSQSWAALRDMHRLSVEVGLKGLIILFDEFEDVIHNIKNVNHKEAAFWNLFEFYLGSEFEGMTFFAVTPDFVTKCKTILLERGRLDYDYGMFDKIPTFEMTPLELEQLQKLAVKILTIHSIAYQWEPKEIFKMNKLKSIVSKAASIQIQDRARHTIREIVKYLDGFVEGAE
jgi:hypothetical protein